MSTATRAAHLKAAMSVTSSEAEAQYSAAQGSYPCATCLGTPLAHCMCQEAHAAETGGDQRN